MTERLQSKPHSDEAEKKSEVAVQSPAADWNPIALLKDGKQIGTKQSSSYKLGGEPSSLLFDDPFSLSPATHQESMGDHRQSSLKPFCVDDDGNKAACKTTTEKNGIVYFDNGTFHPDLPRELLSLAGMSTDGDPSENTKSSAHGMFKVEGDLSALDKKRPTVAFFDNFDWSKDEHPSFKFDGMYLGHGLVSALSAAKNGYNVVPVEVGDSPANGSLLKDLSDTIKNGTLPLGRGDVVNISLGENMSTYAMSTVKVPGTGDPSFEKVNEKLKHSGFNFKITPENLKENREHLLDALSKMAQDKSDPEWQKRAQSAVEANAAIKEIQDRGIEIVHAAGNDGPDHVDLNFLRAEHQLSSIDPVTQKIDQFSANNSLTEPEDGMVTLRRAGVGQYVLGNVPLNSAELCQVNYYNCGVKAAPLTSDQRQLTDKFTARTKRSLSPTEITTPDGLLIDADAGTSFSNIPWLQKNQARLAKEKDPLTYMLPETSDR
ncbi:unnamed protein product [Sphagnum balticum]